jgi:hypothetical protein
MELIPSRSVKQDLGGLPTSEVFAYDIIPEFIILTQYEEFGA